MQNLYYNSGPGVTSSLLLVKEDKTPEVWVGTITDLIISGTLGEIIAYSGSNKVVAFPIENTNLYYGIDYTQILYPTTLSFQPPLQPSSPQPTPITLPGVLNWTFGFTNIDPDYVYLQNPYYYISSSLLFVEESGSAATGSKSLILTTGSYKLYVSGAYIPFPSSYTSSIVIYDITADAFNPILDVSGSSNVALTASLFISSSHDYNAYLFISGTYVGS